MNFELNNNNEVFEQYELWKTLIVESAVSTEIKDELLMELESRKGGARAFLASMANILDRLYPAWVQFDAGEKRKTIYNEQNLNQPPEGEAMLVYELFVQLRSDQ